MLTVEDGTGKPDANAFVTVAEADTWIAPLQDPVWTALTDPTKEQHIVIGARYVSNGQIYFYSGGKQFIAQSLAWPRTGALYRNSGPLVPDGSIPIEIKLGNIAAALTSAHGELPTMPGGGGGPAAQTVQTEKVGELSVTYFDPLRLEAKAGTAAKAPLGGDALADLGVPAVTGIVAPLLDEDFYAASAEAGTALKAPIVGPAWSPPMHPPIFTIGMTDSMGTMHVQYFRAYMARYAGTAS